MWYLIIKTFILNLISQSQISNLLQVNILMNEDEMTKKSFHIFVETYVFDSYKNWGLVVFSVKIKIIIVYSK